MDGDLIEISSRPVDLAKVYSALTDSRFGAQLVFTGVVRDENEGQQVEAVSYEAYSELALAVFTELAREARAKVHCELKIVLIHRTGRLSVSEISTVIGVASPHRAESYEVSRYLIEQLKVRLPVWKEEHYINGKARWLDGAELSGSGDTGGRTLLKNGPGQGTVA